jgi:hypothetical protein
MGVRLYRTPITKMNLFSDRFLVFYQFGDVDCEGRKLKRLKMIDRPGLFCGAEETTGHCGMQVHAQ